MRFTARLGKRSMARLPDEVIKKLQLREGDIVIFDIDEDIKVFKAKV